MIVSAMLPLPVLLAREALLSRVPWERSARPCLQTANNSEEQQQQQG
jgi:hypothetical protein